MPPVNPGRPGAEAVGGGVSGSIGGRLEEVEYLETWSEDRPNDEARWWDWEERTRRRGGRREEWWRDAGRRGDNFFVNKDAIMSLRSAIGREAQD